MGRRLFSAARVLTLAATVALMAWTVSAALGSNGGGQKGSSAAGVYGNAYGQQRVEVCHKGHHTIAIAPPAVPAHLAHGDTMGACT